MAGKIRVEVEFMGVVNGVPVVIAGRGHVGAVGDTDAKGSDPAVPGRRRLDIELLADAVPLGFDPAFLVLGGLDALLLLTVRGDALSVPDARVLVHTDWALIDEGHRELGRVRMALRIEAVATGIEVRGQFLEARTNMEAMERVTSVERVCVGPPVPLDRDGAVLTSTAAFETSFGHEYVSVATSRIVGVGDCLGSLGRSFVGAEIRELTIGRAGGRERDVRILVGAEFAG